MLLQRLCLSSAVLKNSSFKGTFLELQLPPEPRLPFFEAPPPPEPEPELGLQGEFKFGLDGYEYKASQLLLKMAGRQHIMI